MDTLVGTGSADILLVDDRRDQLLALQAVVADLRQNVVMARSGREALRHLLQRDFAVIILDVNMPGMDGYETAALIRQRRNSEHTPIIFVSAHTASETHISQGYSLGAVDYIQRPIVPEVLRAKVAAFVELHKKSQELRQLQAAEHRRRLEEAQSMLEVQTKRNLFFALSLDLLCIVGFDGYFKQLNPAWQKTLGFGEDELRESPLLGFVHEDDRVTTREQLQRLRSGAEVDYFENRFRCADGSYRWLGWTAAPFGPGELIYMCARDITESRILLEERARHLIQEQRRGARLGQLAAASIAINSTVAVDEILVVVVEHARQMLEAHRAIACWATDSNWSRVQRARSRSEEYADRNEVDLESSNVETMLRCIDKPMCLSSVDLGADSRWASVVRNGNPDEGIGNCIYVPLTGRQAGNMGYILVCDRREGDFGSEDEFLLMQLAQMGSLAITNALYFEAREANRMKDEFLATLSHELRTPLTAILGWTWLLRSNSAEKPAPEEALEVIERNARVQTKLIDDMLDISRITSGRLRLHRYVVHLPTQVQAAVDALRPAATAKGVRLEVEVDPELAPVMGDADRLQQVVSNLVANAIKFTPKDGWVRVQLASEARAARIVVSDSGIGIAPEFLPHVFERFRQADAAGVHPQRGLGLGLAIVRHLVELHGGTVEAASAGVGQGASFTVRVPLVATSDSPALPADMASPPLALDGQEFEVEPSCLQSLRVLVVDDDEDSRTTVAMVLRQFKAVVFEAGSAEAALEAVLASPDRRLDVLVSDIAMPGEDGYALIRRLRRFDGLREAGFVAVAVTAFAREEDAARARAAGFQAHVSKPVTPQHLVAVVASLVAERRTS